MGHSKAIADAIANGWQSDSRDREENYPLLLTIHPTSSTSTRERRTDGWMTYPEEPMTIKEVAMYEASCDVCGVTSFDRGAEYAGWAQRDS